MVFDTATPVVPVIAPSLAPVAAASVDYTLADGTVLTVSSLEVGGSATINGAPAPAMDYTLPDTTIVSVDATGKITAVTPPAAPAPAPGMDMSQIKTPEQLNAAMQKFAVGTPEERVANLETICKALMEYNFGWQIREAQDAATRAQAIEVYKTGFEAQEQKIAKQQEIITQMLALVEEMAKAPTADPLEAEKKTFSFSKTEIKNKSLAKYAEAAKKLSEQNKN